MPHAANERLFYPETHSPVHRSLFSSGGGEIPSSSIATIKSDETVKSADMTSGMGKKKRSIPLNSQTYLAIKAVQWNCGGFVRRAPSEHMEAYAEDKDLIERWALAGL